MSSLVIAGLGRMGGGVATRLLRGGHAISVYNRTAEKATEFCTLGAHHLESLEQLTALPAPRIVWCYLPAGSVTEDFITECAAYLEAGDVIVDGGNTHFINDAKRHEVLAAAGIGYVDAGTSGGVRGVDDGYCVMIGGNPEHVALLEPFLPAVTCANGYAHVGPVGAGHYVKMVHNGIEYGMMQAYAEGVDVLVHGQFKGQLSLPQVTALWQHGSIIRSFLGELLHEAAVTPGMIERMPTQVGHNGEAAWMVEEAKRQGISTPVVESSLEVRRASAHEDRFAYKVLSALRFLFGGHTH